MHLSKPAPRLATLQKQSHILDVSITNEILTYSINVTVGTPPQEVHLLVDTGSSDTWIMGHLACNEHSTCDGGIYNHRISSSVGSMSSMPSPFWASYGVNDNTNVTGFFVQEDCRIGGITIPELSIGVATNKNNFGTGILGLGFSTGEAHVVNGGGKPCPTLIDTMVEKGLIGSRVYSLWLNDLDASSGSILFGGHDTSKFNGPLTTLPIMPSQHSKLIDSMIAPYVSLSLTDSSNTTHPLPPPTYNSKSPPTSHQARNTALLDSGWSLTTIPQDIYHALSDYFDVIPNPQPGIDAAVRCSIGTSPGSLNFNFGVDSNSTISVPFAHLALPINKRGKEPPRYKGEAICRFGLESEREGEQIIFGTTFLRSAYVVYDLDNEEIGIAQTRYGSIESSIVDYGTRRMIGHNRWRKAKAMKSGGVELEVIGMAIVLVQLVVAFLVLS